MKKIVSMLIIAASMCTMSATLAADNEPSVFIDGEQMIFDVNPFIENDRTLVPMRAIFEAVGANVQWDAENRTVHAVRVEGERVSGISLQIDSTDAFVNSEKMVLDVPAKIKDDRTFVPLRFVIEALGEKVEWDGEEYAVIITTD